MLCMEDPRNSKRNFARWNIDKVRYHLDKPVAPSREIRRLDSVLRDVLDDLEESQNEDVLIVRDAWPELAGQQIASHSMPASLEYHVLRINVDHPGWMPELKRMERILLQKLQSRYPDLRIRQLRFVLIHR
jgi:predicted nucleic acid-binding Zn ribbon protein